MLACAGARRYNVGMRRPTRFGLAAAVLLVAVFGAYSAYWVVTAGRIEDGFGRWAGSLRAQNLDLSWRAIRVGGFPLVFRVTLSNARLRDTAAIPVAQLQVPLLSGSARPWNFRVWQLRAPGGLSAIAGPADKPKATLNAKTATGTVAIGEDGGAAIWLGLDAPAIASGVTLAARGADIWVNLPPQPPQTHTEPAIGLALKLRDVTLPAVPAPLRNPLDELSLGVTVRGAISAAPPRQAAAAWRDAGGTLELDHFALRWGTLATTGSGTLALGPDLQPIGAFSGAIEGYDELVAALVASGQLPAGEARLARLALGVLAKPGPDGRPQIATSFTLQDGEMYLGPVKLGKAPRIAWP